MPENAIEIKAIINGEEAEGVRQLHELELLANFDGGEVQASITTTTFNFVGRAAEIIWDRFQNLPTEGVEFIPQIGNGTIEIGQKYYIKFDENFKVLSTGDTGNPIELEATIGRDSGVASFLERASGTTMQLAFVKGFLSAADWEDIPYVVENRKTILEHLQLQLAIVTLSKAIYDEVHKMLNIVSDILSIGAFGAATAAALIDLAVVFVNLVLLTIQFVQLIIEFKRALAPPIRLHKGVNIFRALVGMVAAAGYPAVSTDLAFKSFLEKVYLVPSKRDEVGPKLASFFSFGPPDNVGDGRLKPNDFGYTLDEMVDLYNMLAYTKVAVIDDIINIYPENSPFWVNSSTWEMPDVLIEQALEYDNGVKSYNTDDIVSRTVIRYAQDDSDRHTLTNVNNSIAEVIWEPVTVEVDKRVNIKGVDEVNIPYALAVRKDAIDFLGPDFEAFIGKLKEFKNKIEETYENKPVLSKVPLPKILDFVIDSFVSFGAIKTHDHYFSTPKLVYLTGSGKDKRIPINHNDFVGANALFTNYHSYKAMAPNFRNPSEPSETNQKTIYTDVTIPFGIEDWNQLTNNSWFTFASDKTAKFTSIKWTPDRDIALVSFEVFENWNNNLKGTLVNLA